MVVGLGPSLGLFSSIALLVLLSIVAFAATVVYFRATGAEEARQSQVREAVKQQRAARHRPPLLSSGEVPANPSELLRSQNPWWRRILRR